MYFFNYAKSLFLEIEFPLVTELLLNTLPYAYEMMAIENE